MPNRFEVPAEDSPPPSTPDRGGLRDRRQYYLDSPSTTPAGPPPQSASGGGSTFTPAGAPSSSYLGSSLMQGVASAKQPQVPALNFGRGGGAAGAGKARKPLGSHQALGRSIQPTQKQQPQARARSGLSQAHSAENEQGGEYSGEEDAEGEEDDYDERAANADLFMGLEQDAEGEDDEGAYYDGDAAGDDNSDLLLATPAANERIRREAEEIFRATTLRSRSVYPGGGGGPALRRRPRDFKFDAMAKGFYQGAPAAALEEPAWVVLRTEDMVNRLYDEGVGPEEDGMRLDTAVALVAGGLAEMWDEHVVSLPQPDEEHAAEIGPPPDAEPFEHASFLANLALMLQHSRSPGPVVVVELSIPPLPATLLKWQSGCHDPFPHQLHDVELFRPSCAAHTLYWQTVFNVLVRGDVAGALRLLRAADWSALRAPAPRSREPLYHGRPLQNLERAVKETADMLARCPALRKKPQVDPELEDGFEWDVRDIDWAVFRTQAAGSKDKLTRFVEGKDRVALGGEDNNKADGAGASGRSVASLARKAESQVPWEVYENLMTVYEIVLGKPVAIMTAAQDWCEATVGLFCWQDDIGKEDLTLQDMLDPSRPQAQYHAKGTAAAQDAYFDRLARCFHAVIGSDFHFNSMNPVEVGVACVFEGNYEAVLGFLRAWSLPIASATAEMGSLSGWLPRGNPMKQMPPLEDLDMEDLEVLGMSQSTPDEVEGVKDNTLVCYAKALADVDHFEDRVDGRTVARDGWELAVQVLGRMDSPERSEEMVGVMVHSILEKVDLESSTTVDKVWMLLNHLGMLNFAEETAETYADMLARDSHRYGEALWYYALAHRPAKVREVLNLLMSYSLIQSTAYPPAHSLDARLSALLTDRRATLERLAKADLDAAELLGTTLSGYATLRRFYDLRDSLGPQAVAKTPLSPQAAAARRRQAASALAAVVASAGDSIRGGLYDASRDSAVAPDFILALLGEASAFLSSTPAAPAAASGVVVVDPANPSDHITPGPGPLALAHVDVLLKAVEDASTVTGRVRAAANDFLAVVLAAAPPGTVRGSSPADLLRRTSSAESSSMGGSFVLAGSSMLASQLARSVSGLTAGGPNKTAAAGPPVARGWDWRAALTAQQIAEGGGAGGAEEAVLKLLRVGLARELARLWIAQADDVLA